VSGTLRLLASLAVAAALIVLLFWWGDLTWSDLTQTLRSLDRDVYLSALAVNVLIYFARSTRFLILLPEDHRPKFPQMLAVTVSHNLAASVLPAKVGDASLVLYLRRFGISGARGLALLLVSRILDLAAVCLSLAVACVALVIAAAYPELTWLLPLGAVLAAAGLVLLVLSLRAHQLHALVGWFLRLTRTHDSGLGERVQSFADRVADALREVGTAGTLRGALATLPVWIGVFAFYAILARGFGLEELSFAEAVFGAGLAVVANLLPINGFAGLGTQEGGWVLGFGALGVAHDLALRTGLAAHLVYLFNIGILGFIGHLAMGLSKRDAGES